MTTNCNKSGCILIIPIFGVSLAKKIAMLEEKEKNKEEENICGNQSKALLM